jgi:CHAD domain-containing protein
MVFHEWAPRQLHQVAAEFFAAMPHDTADIVAMHRFRIRGKALRYAMELLAPGLDPAIRNEHYPIVEELQERLGAINDHSVARDHLIDWLQDAADAEERVLHCELACHEIARAKQAVAAFSEWWTPAQKDLLRHGLENPEIGPISRPDSATTP